MYCMGIGYAGNQGRKVLLFVCVCVYVERYTLVTIWTHDGSRAASCRKEKEKDQGNLISKRMLAIYSAQKPKATPTVP